jgi:glycosyltransferase involved in cell wall biosynthesis
VKPESGLISVVIPARDSASTINEQLDALSRQSYTRDWEVIVADNGSQDGTRDIVNDWIGRLPNLRLVDAADARGANHARNAGSQASRGERLLFCDADDIADVNWVGTMSDALAHYDMVGGCIERKKLNDEVALAARPLKTVDGLLDSFGFLPYTPFANAGMHREVWQRMGGFDESYRYGSEDVEFFWRGQLAGASMGYAPTAIMHYRLRSDLAGIAHQAYCYGRSHPKLFKTYRSDGMPRSGLRQAGWEWGWIVAHIPWLLSKKPRQATWLYRSAMRWGRCVGSVRRGVLYL